MAPIDVLHPYVGEELVESVGPLTREQWVVRRPQHSGRNGDPLRRLRCALGDDAGEPTAPDPVPPDGRGERSRLCVPGDEVVQVVVGNGEAGPDQCLQK